jgi:hypothetical protein
VSGASTTTAVATAAVRAGEEQWRRIIYHPAPFETRYYGEESERYWREVHPGCAIEVVEHDYGIFRYCKPPGIPVRITPAAEETRSYVEPLAAMHGQFFDAASEVCWRLYPFANKRAWKWHGVAHAALADVYWAHADSWEAHTPASWADQLNAMLAAAERHRVRDEAGASNLRAALEAVWP